MCAGTRDPPGVTDFELCRDQLLPRLALLDVAELDARFPEQASDACEVKNKGLNGDKVEVSQRAEIGKLQSPFGSVLVHEWLCAGHLRL